MTKTKTPAWRGLHAGARACGEAIASAESHSAGGGGQRLHRHRLVGGCHGRGFLRRRRVGRDAARRADDHGAAHDRPAAAVGAAAGIDAAIAGRAGGRAAWIAHRCAARGVAATRPPAMPSPCRFGVPATRDHGQAGERSDETTQQGLFADHRGTSREPRGRKGRARRGTAIPRAGNGRGAGCREARKMAASPSRQMAAARRYSPIEAARAAFIRPSTPSGGQFDQAGLQAQPGCRLIDCW